MQERLSLLLKLTAFFVLHFWVMIVSHYSLRGMFIGLSINAIVGSTAIVLLSALIVIVRRPTPIASLETYSPWDARLALLFWLLGSGTFVVVSVSAFLIFLLLAYMTIVILLAVLIILGGLHFGGTTGHTDTSQIGFVIGSLLIIISSCIAIVFFFNVIVSLVKQAALSKRIEWGTYAVQAIGLTLTLAFFLGQLQDFRFDRLLCSKPYLSPSGQRSIVVEDYEEWEGDRYYSHAYLNGLIFRKDLGNFPNGSVCRQSNLTFNWSADEWQVDWEKLLP